MLIFGVSMKRNTWIYWELDSVLIGFFSACLALASFLVLQRDEKINMDIAVHGIQSMAYPPSVFTGVKLIDQKSSLANKPVPDGNSSIVIVQPPGFRGNHKSLPK